MRSLIEATLIVVFVIFAFIGALRAVTIPVITIPLSLIGVCSLMYAMGYSINLLTLLAMVIAIAIRRVNSLSIALVLDFCRSATDC